MQIWTALSNRDNTGFEQKFPVSSVYLRTPWATEQTYCLCKPTDMKLDMCDANVQKHQFSNLPDFLYCFEAVIQVIVRKLCFINQNSVHLCEKE